MVLPFQLAVFEQGGEAAVGLLEVASSQGERAGPCEAIKPLFHKPDELKVRIGGSGVIGYLYNLDTELTWLSCWISIMLCQLPRANYRLTDGSSYRKVARGRHRYMHIKKKRAKIRPERAEALSRPNQEYLREDGVERDFPILTRPWLRKHRRLADGPPFVRVGRMIFYRRSSIEAWLAAHEVAA